MAQSGDGKQSIKLGWPRKVFWSYFLFVSYESSRGHAQSTWGNSLVPSPQWQLSCNFMWHSTMLYCISSVYINWDEHITLRGMGSLGYFDLACQNPHPIVVYSVAKYRPHLSHFWETVILKKFMISLENFSLRKQLFLLTAGDISRGGMSAIQQQKFHSDDVKSVWNPLISDDWAMG